MQEHDFIPFSMPRYSEQAMRDRGDQLFKALDARRSVRQFSPDAVPRQMIETAIRIASTAPSGAHRQPWKFVAVEDVDIKRQIRIAAEKEEYQSYEGGRMSEEWLEALRPLGTDWHKPYLETVPWIVVAFEETYRHGANGEREKNYYVKESVGLACGLFIVALHQMGLATLTHTPSPMGFLSKILNRPENERPFILFPIGFPAGDATVPDIQRKALDDVAVFV